MSDWFQQQFGDPDIFAMRIALGRDHHPTGDDALDATWGEVQIWTSGRCLTRSVSDHGVVDSVRWALRPLVEWLIEVGVRLVNEDPYPRFSRAIDVADGSEWFDATASPPLLTEAEETRWFLRRSEWRRHHGLRRALVDAALPNVVFHRLGDAMEISWDNESWGSAQPALRFVESRGRILVPAEAVAESLIDALRAISTAWARRTPLPTLVSLAERASSLTARPEDWRWLVHRTTASAIRVELPELAQRLDEHATQNLSGLHVPHTDETQVLRQVRLESGEGVRRVLDAAAQVGAVPIEPKLQALLRPRPAASRRPWEAGNEHAERVRDALGWGTAPIPDLAGWLSAQGVAVPENDLGLPRAISLIARRTPDLRALAHVNPAGGTALRQETGLATAFGHLLLDVDTTAIDGDWEHWPTAARARAFGVALLLPEDGLRDMLGAKPTIGAPEVEAVMRRFRAGPLATTNRLANLGFIHRDQRAELVPGSKLTTR